MQYSNSAIGNSVSYRPTKEVRFPSVTVCIVDKRIRKARYGNLVELLDAVKPFTVDSILEVTDLGINGPKINLVDGGDDLFKGWIIMVTGKPSYCLSYSPPNVTRMGLQNRVGLYTIQYSRILRGPIAY